MQIQPPISAAGAASIAAQATSKDATNNPAPAGNSSNQASSVEQSEQSNQDRDAQGQGDGLADRGSNETARNSAGEEAKTQEEAHKPAPRLPGQPPARLDIMG